MSYLQSSYPLIAKRAIAKQTYDFTIHCPEIAIQSRAGQFVHIRVPGHTLRRPISICGIDAAKGTSASYLRCGAPAPTRWPNLT